MADDMLIWVIVAIVVMAIGYGSGIAMYVRQYKRVPPNKAMIVFGGRRRMVGPPDRRGPSAQFEIVLSGGKYITPIIKSYAYLPLDVRTLDLSLDNVLSDIGGRQVKLKVKAAAQVKIGSDEASLRVAAEHLLGKKDEEINDIAMKMLDGHVRSIFSCSSIDRLAMDRDMVMNEVVQRSNDDLKNMGLEIRGFSINEIEGLDKCPDLGKRGIRMTDAVTRLGETLGHLEKGKRGEVIVMISENEGVRLPAISETNIAPKTKVRVVGVVVENASQEKSTGKKEV